MQPAAHGPAISPRAGRSPCAPPTACGRRVTRRRRWEPGYAASHISAGLRQYPYCRAAATWGHANAAWCARAGIAPAHALRHAGPIGRPRRGLGTERPRPRKPRCRYGQDGFCRAIGRSHDELTGQAFASFAAADGDRDRWAEIIGAVREHCSIRSEMLRSRQSGAPFWLGRHPSCFVLLGRDISETLPRASSRPRSRGCSPRQFSARRKTERVTRWPRGFCAPTVARYRSS
jgi:hypothetical protein